MERSVGRGAEDAEEIAESRLAVVLHHEDIIFRGTLQEIAVDAVEARVVVWLRLAETPEIRRRAIPHPVA